MVHYKLTYFPFGGRAEAIRLILHHGGADFEDNRISREKWPEIKPCDMTTVPCHLVSFLRDIVSSISATPMGQVPVFEVDGKALCQSTTIARYLARQFKLTGADDWEAAQIDALVDGAQDLLPSVRPVIMALFAGDEDKKKAEWAKVKAETLPSWLERYEGILKKNATGWLVGNELTWGDIWVGDLLDRLLKFDASALDSHPELNKLRTKVFELPNIKKYVANRPDTPI